MTPVQTPKAVGHTVKSFITVEEVLDLIAHYGWEISVAFDQVVMRTKFIDWDREHFV
jgi:hypothetical protein